MSKRPSLEELEQATYVRVRTVDPNSAGFYVAGELVTPESRLVAVDRIRERGKTHLRALATRDDIEVQISQ